MAKTEASTALSIELASAGIRVAFERLVRRAERAGISVVVDSDAVAIKLVPTSVEKSSGDLRGAALDTIRVHNACGSASAKVSGDACSYGVL